MKPILSNGTYRNKVIALKKALLFRNIFLIVIVSRKLKYTIYLIFMCFSIVIAQDSKLQQITPQSPNIANFEKVKEIPVGLGTGTVNLSILLYEINVGNLKIPITLSYNNNGLKCDEIPSWVGFGWSLFTGGYLAYQQHGLNDFDPNNGLFPNGLKNLNKFYNNQMSESEKRFYFSDIIAGNIDSEFDEYFYNFSGNAGSFHFVDSEQSRTNPKSDLNITKTSFGFKILDDQGNAFYFESHEGISAINPINYDTKFSDASAIYITKIITADKRIINFTYKTYSLQYSQTKASISYVAPDCNQLGGLSNTTILTTINYLLPDEIKFPSGSLKFNHSSDIRADLKQIDPNTTAKYITGISVYNAYQKIKEFKFDLGYFGSDTRLKLNGVAEAKDNTILKKWEFEYNQPSNISFPPIFSKAKDHWGFFNGIESSNNFPRANYSLFVPNYNNSIVPDAVRTSNSEFSKIGTLKSIKYPTGGSTDFEYEQNQFVVNNYEEFPFLPFLELPNSDKYTVTIAGGNATYGNVLTGSFTIPHGGGYYKLHSWKILSPDPFYNGPEILFSEGDDITTRMLNSNMMQCDFSINQCVFSDVVFLKEGVYNYTIKGSSYDTSEGSTYYLYAGFDLNGMANQVAKAYPVGGIRIAKVTSKDSESSVSLIKKYVYNDSLSHVSIKNIPYYLSTKSLQKVGNGGAALYCLPCGDKVTISEESVKPIIGPAIEYGLVTEQADDNGESGKTNKYLSFSNQIGGSNTTPVVTPTNTSWTSGLLLNEQIFKKNDLNLKRENRINYSLDYLSSQIQGLRVEYDNFCPVDINSSTYSINPATVYSSDFKMSSNVLGDFSDSGMQISNKSYIYDSNNHQNPQFISRNVSDNSILINRYNYVFDYNNLSISSDNISKGLQLLKLGNINLPVEEITIKKINNVEYVIAGTLKSYKSDQTVLDELYELDVDVPILLSQFNFSSIDGSGTFIMDSRYVSKIKFDKYDLNNNLLMQHLKNGTYSSYLYSYDNQYVIAQIDNVDYSTIEGILGGASGISNSSAAMPTDAQVKGWINQLRNSPQLKDAHITSYTYKPLVGMTSMTDPKGMTTTYEYDDFSRLKSVKDQNGNILKQNTYHYKN